MSGWSGSRMFHIGIRKCVRQQGSGRMTLVRLWCGLDRHTVQCSPGVVRFCLKHLRHTTLSD